MYPETSAIECASVRWLRFPACLSRRGGSMTIANYAGPGLKTWSVNHPCQDTDTPWILQEGHEMLLVVIEDDVHPEKLTKE